MQLLGSLAHFCILKIWEARFSPLNSTRIFSSASNVALSDPESMKLSHIIVQSPCDWETTLHQNVVVTIFHTQNICHHAWKTVKTTLQGEEQ